MPPGAPKALYGFEPAELVGRPLAAAVNVFGLWRRQFGEDGSLLALLAAQAMEQQAGGVSSSSGSSTGNVAGSRQALGVGVGAGASWRMAVHLPVKDSEILEHAAHLEAGNHHAAGGEVREIVNCYSQARFTKAFDLSLSNSGCACAW